MKARKIDLTNYSAGPLLPVMDDDGKPTGQRRQQEVGVRESLIGLLFHEALQLNKLESRKREKVALKIEEADNDEVLLSTEEWAYLVQGSEVHKAWPRHLLPVAGRIDDAEEVPVEEAVPSDADK